MKYKPGNYKIYFFDAVGSKMPDATIDGDYYVESLEIGKYKLLQEGEEASFIVMRIIHNSAVSSNKTWN